MKDEPEGASPQNPEQLGISELPGIAAFAGMGATIAASEAIFIGLGLWADHTWGTGPWGLVIGIVLGTVAAVVSVMKQVRRFL